MITLKNMTKTFQTPSGTVEAVRNIDLTIEKGEIFGVIGYSGAGKSTLIRMLNLLETPTAGEVIVAGAALTSLSAKELRLQRQKIGMIFQHFNLLWSRTVFENIAFSLEIAGVAKAEIAARTTELIQLVGLEGREKAYPSQLSGGQKQRVGIARALANRPQVLLCDEATSALDPQTTDEILALLKKINEKYQLTIVLITHEMDVIRKICHRVAIMEKGTIVEEGKVLDIFHNPKHPVTRRFIGQDFNEEISADTLASLISQFPEGNIVLLKYLKEAANQSVITQVIRGYEVDINILHGKIVQTSKGGHGSLFVQITGSQIEEALAFIQNSGIEVEVVK